MKKFMSIAVAMLVIALTACVNELKPTGDLQKDATSLGEKIIEMLKGVKSIDDLGKLNVDLTSLQQEFLKFYKEKGDEDGFIKALTDYSREHAAELLTTLTDNKLADAAKAVLKATCAGAVIPTGDAKKDTEGLFNWFVEKTKGVKSLDEMKSLDAVWSELGEGYNAFYTAKGEDALKEFEKVGNEYAEAHKADLEAAQAEVAKNLGLDPLANVAKAVVGAEESVESTVGELDKALNQAADSIHSKAKKAVNDAVNEAASKAANELTKALGF